MIVPAATLALAAGLFVLDLLTPSGTGEWGLYLIPVLISFRARQEWYPLALSGVCGVMAVLGSLWSPAAVDIRYVALDPTGGVAVLLLKGGLLVTPKPAEPGRDDPAQHPRADPAHLPLAGFLK